MLCGNNRFRQSRIPLRERPGLSDATMALAPAEMRLTMRSEVIKAALAHGAVEGADSSIVANGAVRALDLLLRELKPLVGELALRALYFRSLHLAGSSFERPSRSELEAPDALLAPLHRDLVSRPPAEARGAAEALLLALANLLVSLIGEPLTDRLLHKAWAKPIQNNSSQVTAL